MISNLDYFFKITLILHNTTCYSIIINGLYIILKGFRTGDFHLYKYLKSIILGCIRFYMPCSI